MSARSPVRSRPSFHRVPVAAWPAGSSDRASSVPGWLIGTFLILCLGFLEGAERHAAAALKPSAQSTGALGASHLVASDGLWNTHLVRNRQGTSGAEEVRVQVDRLPVRFVPPLLQAGRTGAVAGRSRDSQATLRHLSIAVQPDRLHGPPSTS